MLQGSESSSKKISEKVIRSFREIVGEENVLSKDVELLLYSYDSSVDRAMPSAVLFPATKEEIASLVRICRDNKIPFVARGAGTNLCGGTVPLRNAVVIAPTKMKRILSIDAAQRTAVVQPGLPNSVLNKSLEPYGLFYAPDPSSQRSCTIGGNIAMNAGGSHCLKYGVTSHHLLGLEIVLPDGEAARFNIGDPGYDLTGFCAGSEGTLGIITEATLNLLPVPKRIETMLVSFPDLESATQSVTEIIASGIIPATLEAMDKITVHAVEAFVHAGYPLDAGAVLLVEVDGDSEVAAQVEEIKRISAKNGSGEFRLARDEKEREKLWEGRRGSYPSMARLAPNVLVEDGVIPRNRLPEATRKIRAIADENNLRLSLIFHAGDGNIHPQILFDERDLEMSQKVRLAGRRMLKVCVDLGGTISGEHGIGIDKREAMRWLFTPQTLAQFRRIKNVFDPFNLSNPDKLLPEEKIEDEGNFENQIPAAKDEAALKNEAEIVSMMKTFFKDKKRVLISGTKSRFNTAGFPHKESAALSTLPLNEVIEHAVDNFTVTVQSGMKMADLGKWLKEKNQKLLLPMEGSVGGMIAANPRTLPRIREQLLGMRVLLADGSIVVFGGKVMKNVAGYDALKLFIGSRGSLGVILSATLKTYSARYPLNAKNPAPGSPPNDPAPLAGIFKKIKSAFDPENIFYSLEELNVSRR